MALRSSPSCTSSTSSTSFVSPPEPPPTPRPSQPRSNRERRPRSAHEDCCCFRESKKSNACRAQLSHNRKVQRHVRLFLSSRRYVPRQRYSSCVRKACRLVLLWA